MKQCKWLELIKDYDCEILHQLGKANRVADALCWNSSSTLISICMLSKSFQKEISDFGMEIITEKLSALTSQSNLLESIKFY